MTNQPTPEEIALVDAYRKAQQAEQRAESQRRRAEQEAAALADLSAKLVGRTIARVEAAQDYSDFGSLRLFFDDAAGSNVEIKGDRWSDSNDLDITFYG